MNGIIKSVGLLEKNVRKLLRKSLDRAESVDYCCARREYKKLLQQKRKKFNENVLNNLMQSVSDQQAFWQNMCKILNKYQPHNRISEQEWYNHFQKVLEQDNSDEDSDDNFKNCESDVYYDRPITQEVLLAIQRSKNGKAAGPDRIIGELLKHAGHLAVNFLVKFFNVLFDHGIYPDSWTEGIIVHLFKRVTKMIQTTTEEYLYATSVVSYTVPLLTGYRSELNTTI